jgi:hypothetical protein
VAAADVPTKLSLGHSASQNYRAFHFREARFFLIQ